MLLSNIFYITSSYNENNFRLLIEVQLSKAKGYKLSDELIEQSLVAYLECKGSDPNSKDVLRIETFLDSMGIVYSYYRSYCESEKVFGKPLEAVKAFNQLAKNFVVQEVITK